MAVAELVGGSEPAFVEQMNARAASLGMEQTSFRNACGLDAEGHLSTARDVATMSRTILNTCPEVLHYTGIWTDTLRGGATQLINTNKLLRRYEGITGLKTGTTGGAGICISASATRNGLSLIAVILGAPSSADRFNAATTLLDYGFGAYEAAPLPKLEAQPLQITVKGSAAGSVPLDYAALPETVLVEKGSGASLHTELTLPEELEAPVEQGQTLGKAAVYQGEALLEEYEVGAAADAPRMTVRDAIGLLWQRQRGRQRPAGLRGPAGDGAGGEGERGVPAYRADPARGAGSPGGAGPDAGQSRGLSGRSTSGRVRSGCCRRCAEDDRPGCHRSAVAEPHRRGMTENCALPVKNGQRGQRMAWTIV